MAELRSNDQVRNMAEQHMNFFDRYPNSDAAWHWIAQHCPSYPNDEERRRQWRTVGYTSKRDRNGMWHVYLDGRESAVPVAVWTEQELREMEG